jgi:hypothetical protein
VDASGKLKGILTLDDMFQQKKAQCKALKMVAKSEESTPAQVTTHAWHRLL